MKSEEEIASQLPEIIITPMYCQMDSKTAKIHDKIMEDLNTARNAAEAIEKKITASLQKGKYSVISEFIKKDKHTRNRVRI